METKPSTNRLSAATCSAQPASTTVLIATVTPLATSELFVRRDGYFAGLTSPIHCLSVHAQACSNYN
jgi:hypothetical protein